MNLLKEWATIIYLMPDKKLREPGSKHQRKIREIQALIIEARDDPSQDILNKLLAVKIIDCQGNTEYEAQTRYLQYCIPQLLQASEKG